MYACYVPHREPRSATSNKMFKLCVLFPNLLVILVVMLACKVWNS